MPRPERLYIDGFEDAPRKLLDFLMRLEDNHRAKSFFLPGWYGDKGIGPSAILRATAELLKSGRIDADMREHFGKIIHVDYSLCKNRRAMQRAIANELNLGHLMAMFDMQDEDDDFRGISISSREEIHSIGSEIHAYLRNKRFLMIFHYEGEEDIDLVECGIPNPDFGTYAIGKLLWTSYGRFKLSEIRGRFKSNPAYFKIISLYPGNVDSDQVLCHLLQKEAAEVIDYIGMDDVVNPAIVLDCFFYSFFLVDQQRWNHSMVDFEWDTHACNYWICDGIFQGDIAWEVGNALHRVIQMMRFIPRDYCHVVSYLGRQREQYKRWVSISSKQEEAQDISAVPANASSYFLTFEGDSQLELASDMMFQLASNNLHVLKLCKCSFDFASPPFRCCHNLRFLWLDRCTNAREDQVRRPCFPNLLVLDIRFTDFPLSAEIIELMTNLREVNTKGVSWRAISHAWKELQNLHKLRVTGSSDVITVDNCFPIDMMNLEFLDLSANIHMESLPTMSSAGNLMMLVLDGCFSLENVALEGAPPLLESFSFDGYGPAEKWTHPIHLPKMEVRPKSRTTSLVQEPKVRRISLKGCAQLRNIFLRDLPNLEELDLSGTSVSALDLRSMDVPCLKNIFLLGCEQLRILCWNKGNRLLRVIQVDTTQGMTRSVICRGEHMFSKAILAFTDGRFIWSVMGPLYRCTWEISKLHLHISSSIQSQVNLTKSIDEISHSTKPSFVPTRPFLPYKDIVTRSSLVWVWDHRQLYPLHQHIEIGEGSHHFDSMNENDAFRDFIDYKVESLHVHDNISITAIFPRALRYCKKLQWCHVERCPKLHTCFPSWGPYSFNSLRIFSASDLPMIYCIWGTNSIHHNVCFEGLQHIYLHNCPRLELVLPISFTLPNLESIQIAYCGNLQHIFPLDNKCPQKIASSVTFKKLKHIKLYHLHKLEQICEARLTVPMLETISLRDCWALRRLPAVSREAPKPVVDCEKDWWDRLEWDLSDANHDPSLFETRHSAHYKKTLPRVSVLR